MENLMPDLILASSSPYRRELLTRLRLPFESASPDIDESHRAGESAEELVRRQLCQYAERIRTLVLDFARLRLVFDDESSRVLTYFGVMGRNDG